MMPFRILLILTFFTFLFSCAEKVEIKVPAKAVERRRLFEIKNIKCIIPDKSFENYRREIRPILEVTLKNVSNFDLNVHSQNEYPIYVWAYDTYIHYPNTGTPIFDDTDSSRVIKKNEEFIVSLYELSFEEFYAYEFQGVNLQLLISSSQDLSFYFEDNPNKPWFERSEGNDHRKKYAYPFEFTYWVTNDVFWEDHLLEHKPQFYWEESTDDK
jgi:hypothetical protein